MEIFDFDDVMLVPRMCTLETRAHADVSAKLGNRTFKIPLMASNMPSVLDENIVIELAQNNYFYVMHRIDVDLVEFSRKMRDLQLFVSISIGVQEQSYKVVDSLVANDLIPDYVTIDVAHGHSLAMQRMISYIKKAFGPKTFIIAGNVATAEGVVDLENWGADAIKVGLGPGYVCSTSIRTGFGTRNWQLAAVRECARVAKKAVIIADGGCRLSGDIVKALYMGADWVMSGYFYAGFIKSPSETEIVDGVPMKVYYGNASARCKKSRSRVEGVSLMVPCEEGTLLEKLKGIEEDLQSAVSFAGGRCILDVRKCEYVIVRHSRGPKESG
ncbi:IMP dehydrogenase / GMP reductase domain family protein [Babesia bovis T2Bo]|uniref:GMP reductase n=1 Tax=Babesia bovis TaxID=5865 RepID=A7AQU8_BABBO|nr:IMP dehydrogenase / GMP reductase domain family protein [Babesia bovis T2Bo]EDO06917.1 IMP dehydrogenase / GMP reductase domain family protein [Babesia bovis T2Bo]BAN65979.1 GMP reductase, putative [Babesia bovis]|eukprot:XP_001610485.1 GMP reductase [Babesia bovis T2Bo]